MILPLPGVASSPLGALGGATVAVGVALSWALAPATVPRTARSCTVYVVPFANPLTVWDVVEAPLPLIACHDPLVPSRYS